MVTIANIQKLIFAYLNGQDIESFGASFADLFYDIEKTGNQAAVQLAYEIESMLASVTAGMLSEPDFKNAMHGKIPSNHFAYMPLNAGVVISNQQVAVGAPAVAVCGYIKPLGGSGSAIDLQDKRQSNITLVQSQLTQVA